MARPQPSRMRTDREYRQRVQASRNRNALRNWLEGLVRQDQYLDNREPPAVSPPSGRVIPIWQKRKPVFKGGLVTGKREGGNTA